MTIWRENRAAFPPPDAATAIRAAAGAVTATGVERSVAGAAPSAPTSGRTEGRADDRDRVRHPSGPPPLLARGQRHRPRPGAGRWPCACSARTSWSGGRARTAVGALRDRCPHREAPLSAGRVEGACVECPYHGWRFDVSGVCRLVPSAGEGGAIPTAASAPAFQAVERYGLVWICLDDPAAPLPEIPEDADPAFRRINAPVDIWRTAATRMVDNFLDIAHFPFVHRGSFGGATATKVPSVELARSGRLVRLPVRGDGGQPRRGRGGVGAVGGHGTARDVDRVHPALRGPQHHPLRHRPPAHPPAPVDATRRRDLRISRSSSGATTTSPSPPRRSPASTA